MAAPAAAACSNPPQSKYKIARDCANPAAGSSAIRHCASPGSNRAVACFKTCRPRSALPPIFPVTAALVGFSSEITACFDASSLSTCRVSQFGTKFAFFGTQKRDSAHSAHAGPALPAAPNGSDEKNSTAYRHAAHRPPERFNRGGANRGTCNAAMLGASRRVRRHFDYSDLDLPFLKQWITPLLSISMTPILTAK